MGKVVVDSSVAVKWFVEEPYSAEARRVLASYESGALDLLAPDLVYAEVGNVVWKKQRFHGMADSEAREIIGAFQALSLTVVSNALLLSEAHQMAVAHARTVYDSLYLALSHREECPFVTADSKLFNATKAAFSSVVWVGDFQK